MTEFDYDAIRGDTAWVVANWGGSGISELNYELLAVRVPALLDRIEVLEGENEELRNEMTDLAEHLAVLERDERRARRALSDLA